MSINRLFFLSLTSLLLIITTGFIGLSQEEWELKKNKNGVTIYTKQIEGSKLKAYRATVEANSTAEEVYDLIMNFKAYPEWQHNCKSGKLIKKIDENAAYVYVVTDAPWPVTDRDLVMKFNVSRKDNGEIKIAMKAGDPSMVSNPNKNVRMDYLKGYWKITPKGNGKVQIIQQIHADPGGSIPDWLANSAVVDTPYETLRKMKTRLER